MHYIKYSGLIVLLIVTIAGCKKKDELFSGGDAVIARFELTKEQHKFLGTIRNDSVIIYTGPAYSLNGAKAFIQISERSTINPDPQSVVNWDDNQVLTVRAYNGTEHRYVYYVERSAAAHDGNLVLTTQMQVDALAEEKIVRVNGDLIIGTENGADSILSLAALQTITTVSGYLKVLPTYAGVNLSGLENISTVGGVQIGAGRNNAAGADMQLRQVSLPALQDVLNNFDIHLLKVKTISFAALHTVGNEFYLYRMDSVETIQFPELKEVHNRFSIQGNNVDSRLTELHFPRLTKIAGNFNLSGWPNLKKVLFPALIETTDWSVTRFPLLEEIRFTALKSVNGRMELSTLPTMEQLDLGKLELVMGHLVWDNLPTLTNLDMLQHLKRVQGILSLYNLDAVTDIRGLKKLEYVGESFILAGLSSLNDPELEGLSSLKTVGNSFSIERTPFKKFNAGLKRARIVDINGQDINGIEEINLSGIDSIEYVMVRNTATPVKLYGKETVPYQLTLEECNVVLNGFKKLKTFSCNQYSGESFTIDGVEEVTGNANFNLYGITDISFPDLKYVGGTLNISAYTPMELSIPKLDSAGSINADVSSIPSFVLPSLKKVNGNFSILWGSDWGTIEELGFPLLKEIAGQLQLYAYSHDQRNTNITHLNAFENLEQADRINISFGGVLADFSGFKKVIPTLSEGSWATSNNLYNPTYTDMAEGRYTKP